MVVRATNEVGLVAQTMSRGIVLDSTAPELGHIKILNLGNQAKHRQISIRYFFL